MLDTGYSFDHKVGATEFVAILFSSRCQDSQLFLILQETR
jgi:hypothetical protein